MLALILKTFHLLIYPNFINIIKDVSFPLEKYAIWRALKD